MAIRLTDYLNNLSGGAGDAVTSGTENVAVPRDPMAPIKLPNIAGTSTPPPPSAAAPEGSPNPPPIGGGRSTTLPVPGGRPWQEPTGIPTEVPPPAAGGLSWVNTALTQAQSTDDPNYWMRVIGADPKAMAGDQSAIAFWQDRIARGDGALAVRNGTLARFNDTTGAGTGGQGGVGNDWTALIGSLVNARLGNLSQAPDTTQLDALTAMLKKQQADAQANAQVYANSLKGRIDELNAPVYSDQQSAALHAQAVNQLNARRDATIKNAQNNVYARGFGPTSGILSGDVRNIQRDFGNQQQNVESQLLTQAISLGQQHKDEAVQLQGLVQQALNGGDLQSIQSATTLAQLEQQQYEQQQANQREQLQTALLPVEMNQSNLASAIAALGSGSPAGNGALASIGSIFGAANNANAQNQIGTNNNLSGIGASLMAWLKANGYA